MEEVFVAELTEDDLQEVLRALEKYPEVERTVCGKKSAYLRDHVSDEYFDHLNFYYHRLARVESFDNLDDTIFKIYLSCNESNFDQVLNELKEKIGHIMLPVDCGHFGIDLIIPGMNKANGLNILKKKWNEEDGKIVAFGDSGNDFEMLEHADFGFAVGNAKDAIKEIADYVIESNDAAGVLDAIDLLLNEEAMFQK